MYLFLGFKSENWSGEHDHLPGLFLLIVPPFAHISIQDFALAMSNQNSKTNFSQWGMTEDQAEQMYDYIFTVISEYRFLIVR